MPLCLPLQLFPLSWNNARLCATQMKLKIFMMPMLLLELRSLQLQCGLPYQKLWLLEMSVDEGRVWKLGLLPCCWNSGNLSSCIKLVNLLLIKMRQLLLGIYGIGGHGQDHFNSLQWATRASLQLPETVPISPPTFFLFSAAPNPRLLPMFMSVRSLTELQLKYFTKIQDTPTKVAGK